METMDSFWDFAYFQVLLLLVSGYPTKNKASKNWLSPQLDSHMYSSSTTKNHWLTSSQLEQRWTKQCFSLILPWNNASARLFWPSFFSVRFEQIGLGETIFSFLKPNKFCARLKKDFQRLAPLPPNMKRVSPFAKKNCQSFSCLTKQTPIFRYFPDFWTFFEAPPILDDLCYPRSWWVDPSRRNTSKDGHGKNHWRWGLPCLIWWLPLGCMPCVGCVGGGSAF